MTPRTDLAVPPAPPGILRDAFDREIARREVRSYRAESRRAEPVEVIIDALGDGGVPEASPGQWDLGPAPLASRNNRLDRLPNQLCLRALLFLRHSSESSFEGFDEFIAGPTHPENKNRIRVNAT